MNKIYRIVWNAGKSCWMVVAEIASSSGPRSAVVGSGTAISLLCLSLLAHAQTVTPTGGNTRSYVAPNGATIVDIATPNGAGVSNNQYTQYNVNNQGLVLNNGNATQLSRYSQLAGQVMANFNLNSEASLILNQVVSTNRSTLAGFTEVVGRTADVVVANPNGITCSGCGFINTSRVTLSTGLPVLNGSGGLSGFSVTQGDIFINGSGLNASAQQILDLVSRSIVLDGQVNARELGVYAGPNEWDYGSRTVTGSTTPVGTAPTYAIDTSALGGMYANKIFLVSTEAGVGVRMRGDAAANNGDFTLTAAGTIELNNKTSAVGNLSVAANGAGSSLQVSQASLSATQNIALSAEDDIGLTGSAIVAGQDLSLTGTTLNDVSDNFSQDNNNRRFAGGNLSASFTGAGYVDGTQWGSANDWQASFGNLTVGPSGVTAYSGQSLQLTASNGDLALGKAQLKSGQDMTLSATGQVSTGNDSSQGIQTTGGNLSVTAGNGLSNAGTISADNGSVTLHGGSAIGNSGQIYAKTAFALADATGNGSESFQNTGSGQIISDGTLDIKAAATGNTSQGRVQAATGSTLSLASLNNQGIWLTSTSQNATDSLTLTGALTNSGTLQSQGDLSLQLGAGVTNNNVILAGGTLSLSKLNGVSYDVVVGNGAVLQGNELNVTAHNLTLNGSGAILSQAGMNLNLNSLSFGSSNAHVIAARGGSGAGSITLASALNANSGIYSGNDLSISASGITTTTTGGIAAFHDLTLNSSGNVSNSGALYAGHDLSVTVTGANRSITNVGSESVGAVGTLNAGGNLSLTASTITNNSTINADGDITLTAATINNVVPGGDKREWNAGTTSNPSLVVNNLTHYMFDVTQTQYYDADYPVINGQATPPKPQIVAGGTLALQNFASVENLGGVLSAPTISLQGNNGSSFTNDDYALEQRVSRADWAIHAILTAQDVLVFQNIGNLAYATSVAPLSSTTIYSPGAAVRATTLIGNNFSLVNQGSPWGASTNPKSYSSNSAQAASGLSFGGINITLPTNPNGYFVLSTDPSAQYLIQTNSSMGSNSNFSGSNYIFQQLGFNPDTTQKRLGDANYEAYLIQQQLIAQTGSSLLKGYSSQNAVLQGLMDNGVAEAKQLGLTVGQAPTAAQLASLTEDIVWMVSIQVNGQTVLAPQVFLAPSTITSIDHGSVIVASNVNLDVDSLSNTGGTIGGSDTLNITAKGDIRNTSGTMTGGNVSLDAGGSITNQTLTQGGGSDLVYGTAVGKEGSISSTGDMHLNAAKDITNLGASVSAGGNASLAAGGNVTFDTVQDKTTNTTQTTKKGLLRSTTTTTTTTTEKQIKSGLTTGGNLSVTAGKDITLAGTDAKVGGNADLNATGDVNLLARADSKTTHSESETSGLGVGGGVYGKSSTVTDAQSNRNVGSTLSVGGNANVNAGGDLTVQGSSMKAGGDGSINASDVKVLAGLDSDTSHSVTKTTTFLSVSSSGSSKASAGADSNASAGGRQASADASAQAGAQAQGSAGLSLASTTTTVTDKSDVRHVASTLDFGGNLTVNAQKDVTLQGSTMSSGGYTTLTARDVNVLAAQDISTTRTHSTTTSIGLLASSNNQANAGAGANASAGSSGASRAGGQGQAGASVQAGASSSNDLTLMRTTTTDTSTLDVTHQGSSISSGGNLTVNASNKVTAQGSSLAAGNDLNLKAKDMSFEAVDDVHQVSMNSSTTSLGLFVNASGSADAGGEVSNSGRKGTGSGSAQASGDVGAGVKISNSKESSFEKSTTAVTSTLSAGGNMNRTASNSITDVGTQISAGGDLNQSANTITSLAARDTTYSTSDASSNTVTMGVYAGASASASADSKKGDAKAEASAGIRGTYDYQQEGSSSSSSNAVVSNITVGGKVNSSSKGATTLEGTNISSGGDVNLSAASLDYKAAANTTSERGSSNAASVSAQVGLVGSVGVEGSMSYDGSKSSSNSSTAVVGSVNSGGKLNINTTGDTRLEGTNLSSADSTNIRAGGNVTFDAAKNTASSSGNEANASVSVAMSAESKELNAEGGYSQSNERSSTAVTGSINAGKELNISSGKDTTLVGTSVSSGGDTSIGAGGNLNLQAARSTSSSESFGVSASGGIGSEKSTEGGKTTSSKSGEFELGGNYQKSSSDTAQAASITSGGNLKLASGGNTTLEGTAVAGKGQTSIAAGGNVDVKAAVSTSSSVGVDASIGGSFKQEKETTNSNTSGGAGKSAAGETKSSGEGSTGFGVDGGSSSKAQAASLQGGTGLTVTSGGNASFAGTQMQSGGDVGIQAAGNVTMGTANSSSVSGSFGVSDGSLSQAQIGGGETKQAVNIQNAGNLAVQSGGQVSLQGTQAQSDGKVAVQGANGVERQAAVSGGASAGLSSAGASVQVQGVQMQGAGRTLVQKGADGSFSVSVPTANMPAGAKVQATTADGKPLPSWLSVDSATGKFSGTPPADFSGALQINVSVPQADGSIKQVPMTFSAP